MAMTRVERGNGWELCCGDCLDPVSGLPSVDKVDHVITDPPYEEAAHTKQRRKKSKKNDAGRVTVMAALSFPPIAEEQREEVSAQIARITSRWAVVFCQIEAAMRWQATLVAGGMNERRIGVWLKPDGQPQYTGDRPGMGFESLVFCHKPGRSTWNGGGKHGVYLFNKGSDGTPNVHQTQKPAALMEQLVRDFTDPGELIADPFAGSGTTGVACIRLGRRFIGWEKDERYFEIAVKRLRAAKEQVGMFSTIKPPKHKQEALLK
jgi:site-specific DNA-methyltransferase (adenine-specific)